MKVQFVKWCMTAKDRTPIAVEPSRVDCIEWFSDAFNHGGTGETFPPATKIIMQGKQEFIVQGDVVAVTRALNQGEK
jgi:hypothetical protein